MFFGFYKSNPEDTAVRTCEDRRNTFSSATSVPLHFYWLLNPCLNIRLFAGWGGLMVEELCESRGGRPGLSVLTSLVFSEDVKQH